MAINQLQRSAFEKSDNFREQVNGFVTSMALGFNNEWAYLDDYTRSVLGQVAKTPESYDFPSVIISDIDWFVTYDPWTENPSQWNDQINIYIEKYWLLLTGIKQPVAPPEPEPEP